MPPAPDKDATVLLAECVKAVEAADNGAAVRAVHRDLAGTGLPPGDWPDSLGTALRRNALVRELSDALGQPRPLSDLPSALEAKTGRGVTEAEILTWLTLGAAAREDSRPLLRPVVHVFARGISGAVVTLKTRLRSRRCGSRLKTKSRRTAGRSLTRTSV